MQSLAYIPSPSEGVWHLGPIPIRAYALMIILGIVVAVWLGERRWIARGGSPNVVVDIAVWAVPFGLVGGRLYHVITDYQRYFGAGKNPVDALKIWQGGLGIWGAVALGGVGAWIGCRRRGISLASFADALAPGIALAQAIGRWGNWWNQELYGRPLHTWWAVKIDTEHRPRDPKYADIATYHPTFLYESLWCAGVAVLVIWAGRRFRLTHGRTFALYVAAYTVGRFWIESLRIDDAHHILGMRLNDWTALIVFLGAVGYLWLARNRQDEERVTVKGGYAVADAAAPATAPAPEEAAVPAATAAADEDAGAERTGTGPENEPHADAGSEPQAEPGTEPVTATAAEPAAGSEPAPEPEPAADAAPAGETPAEEDVASADGPAEDAAETDDPPARGPAPATEPAELSEEDAKGGGDAPVPDDEAADGTREDRGPAGRPAKDVASEEVP
jgi:prolipoprotein diacylglyceryl transferase